MHMEIDDPDSKGTSNIEEPRSRRINAAAICVASTFLLVAVVLIGWTEHNSMCSHMAEFQAQDLIHGRQTDCSAESVRASRNRLVFFSCDITEDGMDTFSPQEGVENFSQLLSVKGTGLRTTVQMYQCLRIARNGSRYTSPPGGSKSEWRPYKTTMNWERYPVDSYLIQEQDPEGFRRKCGGIHNPPWPTEELPTAGKQYSRQVRVGGPDGFVLEGDLVRKVPIKTPIQLDLRRLWGDWRKSQAGHISSRAWTPNENSRIGEVRVTFHSNDWNQTRVTVVGLNKDGVIKPWHARASWLCSGIPLADLKVGHWSAPFFFGELETERATDAWVYRGVGMLLFWLAFALVATPLGVTAGCQLAILPAFACGMGVAGLVWITVRPSLGVPMLIFCVSVFFCITGMQAYDKARLERARARSPPLRPALDGSGLIGRP